MERVKSVMLGTNKILASVWEIKVSGEVWEGCSLLESGNARCNCSLFHDVRVALQSDCNASNFFFGLGVRELLNNLDDFTRLAPESSISFDGKGPKLATTDDRILGIMRFLSSFRGCCSRESDFWFPRWGVWVDHGDVNESAIRKRASMSGRTLS